MPSAATAGARPSIRISPSAAGATMAARAVPNWCRSARPISALRIRSSSNLISGCATIRWNASARCEGSSPRWCWKSPMRESGARPGINRALPCGFPASAASAGTSPPRKPTGWKAWRRGFGIRAAGCLPGPAAVYPRAITGVFMDRTRFEGFAFLAAFIACVPAANWLIGNVGTVCVPQGPCVIPVAPFGITAPSGVLVIGLALVAASVAAFLLSELADFAVYTPLQRRGLIRAVIISSLVGLAVDSVVFLYLAFGSLDYLAGQVIGKAWMVLLSIPAIRLLRD